MLFSVPPPIQLPHCFFNPSGFYVNVISSDRPSLMMCLSMATMYSSSQHLFNILIILFRYINVYFLMTLSPSHTPPTVPGVPWQWESLPPAPGTQLVSREQSEAPQPHKVIITGTVFRIKIHRIPFCYFICVYNLIQSWYVIWRPGLTLKFKWV